MLRQPSTWPYTAHTHSHLSRSASSTRASLSAASSLPQCHPYRPWSTLIAGAARTLATDRARVVKTGSSALRHLPEGSPFWCAISRTSHVFHPTTVLVRLARGMHSSSTAVAGYCVPFAALGPSMVLYRTHRTIPRLGAREGAKG